MNVNRFDDEDDSPEVLDAVSTHVEALLAVQQRLLGDARAVRRHLARLAASLNAPDAVFPPPESAPVLRAMDEVVEQLSRDLLRLQALARRAADRAAAGRRQVSAGRSQAGGRIVDRQSDTPSSTDG